MRDRKTFTLRLETDLLDKLHFVAQKNRRSANNQIEILLEEFIEKFEQEYGQIPLSEGD